MRRGHARNSRALQSSNPSGHAPRIRIVGRAKRGSQSRFLDPYLKRNRDQRDDNGTQLHYVREREGKPHEEEALPDEHRVARNSERAGLNQDTQLAGRCTDPP